MVTIRYIQDGDQTFWLGLDKHISAAELEKKIRDKMGYIITENNIQVGLLRYNMFWDNTPFCTMLFIDEQYQHKGYGRMLMEFWEKEMIKSGYGMVMTSTQVDEDAQHFYRKLGYQDEGGLLINIPGYEQPMEMFLIKQV
ncbi:GNAT family N-acetyltransferase [[Clostridium] symbiosum]|uniref:GNAT family N-acetyltransferase n=1 Tax=Clostridium symbiosum TaxID=1512 RepID=UPI0018A03CE3|nr:GNAT family N-acetyltransferase [[Clostridium] symbiosum]MDB2038307.1 GNAT family N-acetyltransferase [[Clostridium] symbiosum]DAT32650.1 MAG TPA: acetyltransferase domain containing protein [Caudoviricetes sp.]